MEGKTIIFRFFETVEGYLYAVLTCMIFLFICSLLLGNTISKIMAEGIIMKKHHVKPSGNNDFPR